MAKPRIFVSSTYYDLKYVRSSLEVFIESIGYDAVLSEKGAIAYMPDAPLDESCYREAQNSDVYVLIIGGRYGSEASESKTMDEKTFYDRYESITKQEYKAAAERDIPIYVLIERSVYAEYHTFQKNRVRSDINYAHVDSANVFLFIEDIVNQPRNNPIQTFDRYSDIEEWLRDQWAGLFRELLHRRSSQKQIASLAAQVSDLAEVNRTLRRYLEEVIAKVSPDESASIITAENERLAVARATANLEENPFVKWAGFSGITVDIIADALTQSSTVEEFVEVLQEAASLSPVKSERIARTAIGLPAAFEDLNEARASLGLMPFPQVSSAVRKRVRERRTLASKGVDQSDTVVQLPVRDEDATESGSHASAESADQIRTLEDIESRKNRGDDNVRPAASRRKVTSRRESKS
ncbi:MAG: DUF4062 domain-containing protein [Gemmatimonadota bacterium]